MAGTRTVVADLRVSHQILNGKILLRDYTTSMGRTIPLTQSKLFLVGFVKSPSNLASPKFLYVVRNLSLLVELTVDF